MSKPHKYSLSRQAAAMRRKLKRLDKDRERIERMMSLACPKRRRYA